MRDYVMGCVVSAGATLVVFLFVGAATWWLESRFGASAVLAVFSAIFGIVCMVLGVILSQRMARHSLNTAIELAAALGEVHTHGSRVSLEAARLERQSAKVSLDTYAKHIASYRQVQPAQLSDARTPSARAWLDSPSPSGREGSSSTNKGVVFQE